MLLCFYLIMRSIYKVEGLGDRVTGNRLCGFRSSDLTAVGYSQRLFGNNFPEYALLKCEVLGFQRSRDIVVKSL